MHIAHLETGRHRFGGPQQVLQLMTALARAGHTNTLVAATDSEILAHARIAGHAVIAVRAAGDHDALLAPRLARRLRSLAPDLLHVHSRRGADLWGGIAARLIGLPAIITRRVDNPLGKAAARALFWPYRRIIAVSDAVTAALVTAGVDAGRIELIRDAIDVGPLVLAPDRDWFNREFLTPPNVPLVGVVAQFIERKGHHHLLAALPAVIAEYPAARILFFGRGPLEAELRAAVHAAGLAERVVFAGFRDDLARVLPCLDLLVHPATAEGMGVALLEAAAAALPVVAFAAGGIREVVVDGETGRLVPAADSNALGAAIIELLADRDAAQAMGVAARRRIQQSFSVAQHTERHIAIYRALTAAAAA